MMQDRDSNSKFSLNETIALGTALLCCFPLSIYCIQKSTYWSQKTKTVLTILAVAFGPTLFGLAKLLEPSDFEKGQKALIERQYGKAYESFWHVQRDGGGHAKEAEEQLQRIRDEARQPLIDDFEKSIRNGDLDGSLNAWQSLKMIYPEDGQVTLLGIRLKVARDTAEAIQKQKADKEAAAKQEKQNSENQARLAEERKQREYVDLTLYQIYSKTDFEDSPSLTSVQKDSNYKFREQQQKVFSGKWIRGWSLQVWNVYDDHICFNDPNIVGLFYNTIFKKYGWCYVVIHYQNSGLDSATLGRLKWLSKGQWVTVGHGKLNYDRSVWNLEPVEDLHF